MNEIQRLERLIGLLRLRLERLESALILHEPALEGLISLNDRFYSEELAKVDSEFATAEYARSFEHMDDHD